MLKIGCKWLGRGAGELADASWSHVTLVHYQHAVDSLWMVFFRFTWLAVLWWPTSTPWHTARSAGGLFLFYVSRLAAGQSNPYLVHAAWRSERFLS
jgi:hypothetical protein